jgi:glycosyltransferase involved in cell wall biosynthesis
MKIAVYSIALNEAKHVERWYNSAKDADLVLLADTGSVDETVAIAESLGISTHRISINPWRFDEARNTSLALIPNDFDVCIQLDLDEILKDNWRALVEEAFISGNIWPTYDLVLERYPDGKPRVTLEHFKVHPRHGFTWKYPIHELLVPLEQRDFNRKKISLEIEHIPDNSKSRSSYLPQLKSAVQQMPNDWRMNHYLTRELFFYKDWLNVLRAALKALKIEGGWNVERSSTCIWASEASLNLDLFELAKDFAHRATMEAPDFYEAWLWRAHIAHLEGNWRSCYEFAVKQFELKKQSHHLVQADAWEWRGLDLLALSSYKLGDFAQAVKFGESAARHSPENYRLQQNLIFYKDALGSELQVFQRATS